MFIGLKEVEKTSPDIGGITVITYKDGTFEEMRTKLFNASCSPEPLDATALRDLQLRSVAADVLLVLYDWNIKITDFEYLHMMLVRSLNAHTEAADEKLWGKPKNEVTMQDVDNVKRS